MKDNKEENLTISQRLDQAENRFEMFLKLLKQGAIPLETNGYVGDHEKAEVIAFTIRELKRRYFEEKEFEVIHKLYPTIKEMTEDELIQITNREEQKEKENNDEDSMVSFHIGRYCFFKYAFLLPYTVCRSRKMCSEYSHLIQLSRSSDINYQTESVGRIPLIFNRKLDCIQLNYEPLSDKKLLDGPLESIVTVNGMIFSTCFESLFKPYFAKHTELPPIECSIMFNKSRQKRLDILKEYNIATGKSSSEYLVYESKDEILIVDADASLENYDENQGDDDLGERIYKYYDHTGGATYRGLKEMIKILEDNYTLVGSIDEGGGAWSFSCENTFSEEHPETLKLVEESENYVRVEYTGDLKISQYYGTQQQRKKENLLIVARLKKQ